MSPEVAFIDGTCICAKANLKKHAKEAISVTEKRWQEQLNEEIEADHAALEKKLLKKKEDATPPKQKTVAKSTTAPENRRFPKGKHRKCFASEVHTVCDRRGYILEI